MINDELSKALELTGNPAKLAAATGIATRTVYWQVERGYLSYAAAKAVADKFALDPFLLQER